MPLKKEAFDRIAAEREAMKTDPRGWAVQPAAWFNFDPDGCVYCADTVSYTHLTLPTNREV